MFVKSYHSYTWWCTLGGVGTFTKEKKKKLELMWINSAKKWRQKEVTRSGRMLVSKGPARPIMCSREGAVSVK
jgi:hypothetical protein